MPVKFPNLVDMPNSQTVSWDPPSRDWPVIIFSSPSVCNEAYDLLRHARLVQYGEYVKCGYELRISSVGHLIGVRVLLSDSHITSKDILDIRKNGG